MNENQYHDIVEKTFKRLEMWLEAHESEPDYETPQSGVIEIDRADGKTIIINAHQAMQEIWVAAPEGAFHFRWQENEANEEKGEWRDTRSGDEFFEKVGSLLM